MKYRLLLKKAELFERLALFGDKSSFLKALAQTKNVSSTSSVIDKIKNWTKFLPNSIIDSWSPSGLFGGGLNGTNDKNVAMFKADRDALNALDNNSTVNEVLPLANRILQVVNVLRTYTAATNTDISAYAEKREGELTNLITELKGSTNNNDSVYDEKEDVNPLDRNIKPSSQFNAALQLVQQALMKMNYAPKTTVKSNGKNRFDDGLLGPETIDALNRFRENKQVTDGLSQELYSKVLQEDKSQMA